MAKLEPGPKTGEKSGSSASSKIYVSMERFIFWLLASKWFRKDPHRESREELTGHAVN